MNTDSHVCRACDTPGAHSLPHTVITLDEMLTPAEAVHAYLTSTLNVGLWWSMDELVRGLKADRSFVYEGLRRLVRDRNVDDRYSQERGVVEYSGVLG